MRISEVSSQNIFHILSQASFISSGNRTDISLDDPNFWQKWAKIAELEIDSKEEKVKMSVVHLFLWKKCLTVPSAQGKKEEKEKTFTYLDSHCSFFLC